MTATGTGLRAASALAALFPCGREIPLERGLYAVLRAICPGEITGDFEVSGEYALGAEALGLDGRQAAVLAGKRGAPACRRTGYLIDASTRRPVARTTAVILLRHVPWVCREEIGLTRAGSPVPGRAAVPLGRALWERNVYRFQAATVLTPGCDDGHGHSQVLYSEARLTVRGRPIALVAEQVYTDLLDRYPPPWREVSGV